MAAPTVRILSRYLLSQHLAPLGFGLATFTFLMLLRQVAQQFGNLVGKGLPWSVITEVFVLSLPFIVAMRSEEHTSELQSLAYLVCRLLLEKKKQTKNHTRGVDHTICCVD